jgi:hypothetical protein
MTKTMRITINWLVAILWLTNALMLWQGFAMLIRASHGETVEICIAGFAAILCSFLIAASVFFPAMAAFRGNESLAVAVSILIGIAGVWGGVYGFFMLDIFLRAVVLYFGFAILVGLALGKSITG